MEKTEKKTEEKKKIKSLPVKIIAYSAVFVALCIVTNTFTVHFGASATNAVSFTYTVCALAGALLGPLPGFIVGAAGDALGWLINPSGGAFNPVVTLVTGLIGLLSGLTFWTMRKKSFRYKDIILIVVSFALIFLVCTNLNTIAMYYYYMSGKYSFGAYYIMRTSKQIVFWAINLILSALLIVPLRKLIKLK